MRGQGDGVTGFAPANSSNTPRNHRLHRGEHVVLLDEAHFDIELVEFAGQTIGARVLVAEAGGDLKIAVEPRHHQQLLVLLRRLRQRIELSRMDARRNQEVARAFGRRGGEDRRLELGEPLPLHALAHRIDDLAAQHDVVVQLFAPQIEEAVFEPRVLGIRLVAEHRQRQLARRAEHLDLAHINFDLAGRHVRVLGALGAPAHAAVEAHDPFRAQLFGGWKAAESGSTTHCVMP